MPARKGPRQQWQANNAQAGKIMKRLSEFVACDASDPENSAKLMTQSQVQASIAILKKLLPDLKSIELRNPEGEALAVTHVVRRIVDGASDSNGEGVQTPADAGAL